MERRERSSTGGRDAPEKDYEPGQNVANSGNQQQRDLGIQTLVSFMRMKQSWFDRIMPDMICRLPVETASQISFVLCVAAGDIFEQKMQEAALSALKRSSPQGLEARKALEAGKQSKSALVRTTVLSRLIELPPDPMQL